MGLCRIQFWCCFILKCRSHVWHGTVKYFLMHFNTSIQLCSSKCSSQQPRFTLKCSGECLFPDMMCLESDRHRNVNLTLVVVVEALHIVYRLSFAGFMLMYSRFSVYMSLFMCTIFFVLQNKTKPSPQLPPKKNTATGVTSNGSMSSGYFSSSNSSMLSNSSTCSSNIVSSSSTCSSNGTVSNTLLRRHTYQTTTCSIADTADRPPQLPPKTRNKQSELDSR